MQIIYPQPGEIRDAFAQTLKISCKQIHVTHRPDHALRLIPLRIGLTQGIQCHEFLGPLDPHLRGRGQDVLQVVEEIVVFAIESVQATEQAGKVLP